MMRMIFIKVWFCWSFLLLASLVSAKSSYGQIWVDIPSGNAVDVLQHFATSESLEIIYSTSLLEGVRTDSVKGNLTPFQTTVKLLASSNLTCLEDDQTGALVVIKKPSQPEKMKVKVMEKITLNETQMNSHHKKTKKGIFAGLLSVLIASNTISTQAQNIEPENDEIYELTPFEINTTDDLGYDAQTTLSGTRLNTSVKDLGITMTILTEQFMDDMAFSNTNDLMLFTPGGEFETTQEGSGSGPGSSLYYGDNTRFRGLHSENIVRNQFKTNLPSDSYNAGRFEISRGSNSILFGLGNPAGLVNRYTNDAIFTNENTYRLRINGEGGVRQEFNGNRVLVDDKLAIRFAYLLDNDEHWIKPHFQDQERFYGALTYKPLDNLIIKTRYEKIDWTRSAVEYAIHTDAVTPYLDAASAAGHTPEEHALNRNYWVWLPRSSGLADEFREWGYSARNRLNVIFDGSQEEPLYRNWRNKVIGARKRVDGDDLVTLPIDFMPRDFSALGNSNIQEFNGDNTQAVAQYQVNEHLDLEYAFNYEDMDYHFIGQWDNRLYIDTSATLADGVTPNPNVGRFFVDNSTNARALQNRKLTSHRLTASLVYDFKDHNENLSWLGSHNLALMWERYEEAHLWDSMRLVNGTPLPDYREGVWDASWAHDNAIRFINYVDIDKKKIEGVHDARRFLDIAKQYPGINAEWIPNYQTVGTGRASTDQTNTLLAVLQSRFFEDRLVTTFGYRKDKMDSSLGVIGQDPTRPLVKDDQGNIVGDGYGQWAKDVKQTPNSVSDGQSFNTISKGIVFHAIRNVGVLSDLSFYANYSDSFDPVSFFNLPNGTPAPIKSGKTTDYGIKFGLLDGKVNGVFTLFNSKIKDDPSVRNIELATLATLLGYVGETQYAQVQNFVEIADIESKGWELQLTANVTKNWRLYMSVDHYETTKQNIAQTTTDLVEKHRSVWMQDADQIFPGDSQNRTIAYFDNFFYSTYLIEKAQEGGNSMNERAYKVAFVSSYDFREGPLTGLGVGVDLVWQDEAVTGFAKKQVDNGSWVLDPQRPFYSDPITRVGAHIRYSKKLWKDRIDWTIQFNVRNIWDVDPYVVRHKSENSAPNMPIPTRYNRGEPTAYILTNTFKF